MTRRPPRMPWWWWATYVVTLGVCYHIADTGDPFIGLVLGTVATGNRLLQLILMERWGRTASSSSSCGAPSLVKNTDGSFSKKSGTR